MHTTIDADGWIVVPKALRQALGLEPGQLLDIRAGDGRLEIEIAATPTAKAWRRFRTPICRR